MRQKINLDNCEVFSMLIENEEVFLLNQQDAKKTFCYDEFTENPRETVFRNFDPTLYDHYIYQNLCENGTVFPDEVCYAIPGFSLRPLEYPYTIKGEISDYSMNEGYYFDLPLNSTMNYTKIIEFIRWYWWDTSSRLLVISFNALQQESITDVSNPRIINVK
jgi:hypothetical protein